MNKQQVVQSETFITDTIIRLKYLSDRFQNIENDIYRLRNKFTEIICDELDPSSPVKEDLTYTGELTSVIDHITEKANRIERELEILKEYI